MHVRVCVWWGVGELHEEDRKDKESKGTVTQESVCKT